MPTILMEWVAQGMCYRGVEGREGRVVIIAAWRVRSEERRSSACKVSNIAI